MPMNHAARMILKALSFDGIEVEASRHLADLKRLDPMKIFIKQPMKRYTTENMKCRCGFSFRTKK